MAIQDRDPVHLRDVIKRWKETTPPTKDKPYGEIIRRTEFPDRYYDCEGKALGIIHPETEENIDAPWSAYLLDLMEYSYTYCKNNRQMEDGIRFDPPLLGASGFPDPENLSSFCNVRGSFFSLPTFCINVDGEISMYRHSNNYTACYLYAIQTGISFKYWDNRVSDIYPDQSEEKFRLVVEDLEEVLTNKIIKDYKWKVDDIKSKPLLCLHYYYRDVLTCEILSKEEIQNFIRYLTLRNCPGIGVRYSMRQKKPDRYLYTFETSIDSSD